MTSIPFCVIERPFMVWGDDLPGDNRHFLEQIDADLYHRAAHNLLLGSALPEKNEETGVAGEPEGEDPARRDVSSLLRLLWHHGIETIRAFASWLQNRKFIFSWKQGGLFEDDICFHMFRK